jgi:hypothetical protein
MPSALLLLVLGCQPVDQDTAAAVVSDPFADSVVSTALGASSGFGLDLLPEVVLGSPEGAGESAGSTDVLSLGDGGEIVLSFDDMVVVDGDGPDVLVFENAFTGWIETGVVAASEDGETWQEWPCDPSDAEGGYPGCAGVTPVLASSSNGIDPTDPAVAGGDAFDLAELGLAEARYLRVRDSGANSYGADTGGFDLDAVAVINGRAPGR